MSDKPRWSVVLFDMDGTLLDVDESVIECMRLTLSEHFDIERTNDELKPTIGPPFPISLREHFGFDEERVRRFVELYRERYFAGVMFRCSPYEGMVELLTALDAAGIRTAIATSKLEEAARQLVAHFELPCSTVAGASLDGTRMLKADVIERALRLLDHRGGAVMIGDHAADVVGAHANGIDAIGVDWGCGTSEEISAAGPLTVVTDVSELASYLGVSLD